MLQGDIVIPFEAGLRLFHYQILAILMREQSMTATDATNRINAAVNGEDTEVNNILKKTAANFKYPN